MKPSPPETGTEGGVGAHAADGGGEEDDEEDPHRDDSGESFVGQHV